MGKVKTLRFNSAHVVPGDKELYVLGGLYLVQDVCLLDLESERGRGTLARNFVDCALYKVYGVWTYGAACSLTGNSRVTVHRICKRIDSKVPGTQNEWRRCVIDWERTKRSPCSCNAGS